MTMNWWFAICSGSLTTVVMTFALLFQVKIFTEPDWLKCYDTPTKTEGLSTFPSARVQTATCTDNSFFSSEDGVRLNWDCASWTPPTWQVNGKHGWVGAAALTFHTRESPPLPSRGEMRKQGGARGGFASDTIFGIYARGAVQRHQKLLDCSKCSCRGCRLLLYKSQITACFACLLAEKPLSLSCRFFCCSVFLFFKASTSILPVRGRWETPQCRSWIRIAKKKHPSQKHCWFWHRLA